MSRRADPVHIPIPLRRSLHRCPECSKLVDEDVDAFCSSCGVEFTAKHRVAMRAVATRELKRQMLAVLGAALVVAALWWVMRG